MYLIDGFDCPIPNAHWGVGLYLGLCSINMAEAAGQQMISVETRVRLYATIALNFKTNTFKGARFFTRFVTLNILKLIFKIIIIKFNLVLKILFAQSTKPSSKLQ